MLTREYIVMNFLATIVASYGLLQNSTAVVIGAMIIAMLLGPINGLALALNDSNIRLLRRSASAEFTGAVLVLVTSMLIGKLHADIPAGSEILSRTAPNILDLLIALGGGAAGAYAVVSPKLKSSVVGVAISTALVPPLCTCGILFARGDMRLAAGGFILFITNLVTIQVAASAVFWVFGLHTNVDSEKGVIELVRRNGVTLALFGVLAIALIMSFRGSIHDSEVKRVMGERLRTLIGQEVAGATIADFSVNQAEDEKGPRLDTFCTVRTPVSINPQQISVLEDKLTNDPEIKSLTNDRVNLKVQSVITKEANRLGWVHLGTDIKNTATPPDPTNPKPEDKAVLPADSGLSGDDPKKGDDNTQPGEPTKPVESPTNPPAKIENGTDSTTSNTQEPSTP